MSIKAAASFCHSYEHLASAKEHFIPSSLQTINNQLKWLFKLIIHLTFTQKNSNLRVNQFVTCQPMCYYNNFTHMCDTYNISFSPFVLFYDLNFQRDAISLKREVRSLFNVLFTCYKIEEDKHRLDTLKFYVNKHCDDFVTNQRDMILSILERKLRRIVLNCVLVEEIAQRN